MSKKLISLILTVVLCLSPMLNCYAAAAENKEPVSFADLIRNKGIRAEAMAKNHTESNDNPENNQGQEAWKDYVGDIETFVYGLIIRHLEYSFDVFSACVDLADGNSVFGIAYTDYENCYTDEDESSCCFEAGFIPFNGELEISSEEFDSGLNITNLDFTDEKTSFLWVYGSEPIKQHCVIYNKYLQYGIDKNGSIFYETTDYIPGVCDESLGSLYSFDEKKFLLDFDFGNYSWVSGDSLFSQIDYEELEREINRILLTQDNNFEKVDIASCANYAQEAIISYLLSLQEETFLGYNVPELVEAAKQLDPLECYRITSEGLVTLRFEEGKKASDCMKWLVGTGCAVVTAVAIVGSVVFIECPPLSALSGAAAGLAIETFIQVVISEKDISNLDWRKIAVSAAAGAVSGFVGPYISAIYGKVAYFIIDSAVDALIGGVERAAEAFFEGKDAKGIIDSFGTGVGIGLLLSAGFKVLGPVVAKVGSKINSGINKVAEKIVPKLTSKISAIKKGLGEIVAGLKTAADSTIFHSKYISKKTAHKMVQKAISDKADELLDGSLKQLSPDNIVDVNGQKITKKALKNIAEDAKEGAVLGYVKYENETIKIVKYNNNVSVLFDPEKYMQVRIPGGITPDRNINFEKAAEQFKELWLEDPTKVPESLAAAIRNKGMDLEEMMPKDLVNIIKTSDYVIHENIDGITVSLVSRTMHEKVSHTGGVSIAKHVKSVLGAEYFDKLISDPLMSEGVFAH